MSDGMDVLEMIEDLLYDNGLIIGNGVDSCEIGDGHIVIIKGNKTFIVSVVKE